MLRLRTAACTFGFSPGKQALIRGLLSDVLTQVTHMLDSGLLPVALGSVHVASTGQKPAGRSAGRVLAGRTWHCALSAGGGGGGG